MRSKSLLGFASGFALGRVSGCAVAAAGSCARRPEVSKNVPLQTSLTTPGIAKPRP